MNAIPPRHPEKLDRPDSPIPRKPDWIRVKAPMSREYAETRALMRQLNLHTVCEEAAWTVEVLTPEFLLKPGALEVVVEARPDVFNHNLETVPRLYRSVRPGARYFASMQLLARVKYLDPAMFTKSGLMVGLGESRDEVLQVMDDMRAADVDFLTIGQYLQPTTKHHPIDRFLPPEEFRQLKEMAEGNGYLLVAVSALDGALY